MDYIYKYDGPVKRFDNYLFSCWHAVTRAPTKKKALSNLKHQFKAKYGLAEDSKVDLFGPNLHKI